MDVALYCGSVPAVAWSVAPAYFFRELAEARSIIYDYFISVNYAIKFPNGEFRSCSLRFNSAVGLRLLPLCTN